MSISKLQNQVALFSSVNEYFPGQARTLILVSQYHRSLACMLERGLKKFLKRNRREYFKAFAT